MPSDKKFSSSALTRRSRGVRKRVHSEQEKSLWLTAAAPLCSHKKSLALCRHSDELLRRSHELRDRLRKIRNAP